MNTLGLGRFAMLAGAAALLSACGGSSIPIAGANSVAAAVRTVKGAKTFHCTGREQTFLVPRDVRQISVVMRGAAGGGTYFGRGGRVHGIIRVRPGQILYVFVGCQGSHAAGGFNGGGNAGPGGGSYGGGGASDVRQGNDHLIDRILVAGGSGGEGTTGVENGGRGGGKIGGIGGSECGSSCIAGGGGGGGTQTRGGMGGAGGRYYERGQPGDPGRFGNGGAGGSGGCYYGSGSCGCYYANGCPGAGGGGGYYGGGGGGGGSDAYGSYYEGFPGGGGGGGSSWAKASVADFRTWAGWKDATSDGLVVFSW